MEVIGLGAGDIDQLPLGIYRKLTNTDDVIWVRTKDHPVVKALAAEGVQFHSFDAYYEREDQFESVYESIVKTLLEEARTESLIYAVPGHPMLRSEERRVGKECRSRWWREHDRKRKK